MFHHKLKVKHSVLICSDPSCIFSHLRKSCSAVFHIAQASRSSNIDSIYRCLSHRPKFRCHFSHCCYWSQLRSLCDWSSCHPCPNNKPSFNADVKSASTGTALHFHTCYRTWLDVNCLIVPWSAPVWKHPHMLFLHSFIQVFPVVTRLDTDLILYICIY